MIHQARTVSFNPTVLLRTFPVHVFIGELLAGVVLSVIFVDF